MPWAPGQSGNPAGYHGSRRWRHREVFEEIKKLGHRDALVTLSTIQHESQDDSLRVAAAAALAPYAHPKLQALPTPRFIETPIQAPEFTDASVAENFLAKIASLVAGGELDIQTGLELSTLTKNWLDARHAATELELKGISVQGGPPEQPIHITGGLPPLPGAENVIMPQLNSHATNGHGHALAAPADAVPAIEAAPKAQDPEPPPQDPEL